jgi:hypothetical protein
MHHRVLPLPARLQAVPSHFFWQKPFAKTYTASVGQKWPIVLFSREKHAEKSDFGHISTFMRS